MPTPNEDSRKQITTGKQEIKAMGTTSKKTSHIIIACAITVLVVIVAIEANLLINNSIESKPPPVIIEGTIEFSGGHGFGKEIVYVNPAKAKPVASDHSGIEARTLDWWITKPRENEVLYSGQRHDLEAALRMMRETGTSGMYILQFKIETISGDTYRMGRNFYIVPDHEDHEADA